jgi:hypothetical protein
VAWRLRSLALGLALRIRHLREPYAVISRRRWAIEHPSAKRSQGALLTEPVTLLEGLQAA